jgi:hypothetical protein
MVLDPDNPDPRLVDQLSKIYDDAAARLRKIVLDPPGKTPKAQAVNQARAASQLAQVQQQIDDLKGTATRWTNVALKQAVTKGVKAADKQAGLVLSPQSSVPKPSSFLAPNDPFSVVDHGTVKILAQDTVGDLHKAADAMGATSKRLLRKMAATGVTNEQVNQVLAGRHVIEGQPDVAVRELRDLLKKVHGDTVDIPTKNGGTITFKTGYYAKIVATTKVREATVKARHARLAGEGIDLVFITGRISKNFCTAYLDKVFSISGRSKKYPSLSSLPNNGPPFHPNCSKSTQPYIEDLADDAAQEAAAPDDATNKFLNTDDTTALQKEFRNSNQQSAASDRTAGVANSILARAGAALPGGGG